MKKEKTRITMRDKRNKPGHRDLIRGKGLTSGLSLENMDLGHSGATKDTTLLNKGADNDRR